MPIDADGRRESRAVIRRSPEAIAARASFELTGGWADAPASHSSSHDVAAA